MLFFGSFWPGDKSTTRTRVLSAVDRTHEFLELQRERFPNRIDEPDEPMKLIEVDLRIITPIVLGKVNRGLDKT